MLSNCLGTTATGLTLTPEFLTVAWKSQDQFEVQKSHPQGPYRQFIDQHIVGSLQQVDQRVLRQRRVHRAEIGDVGHAVLLEDSQRVVAKPLVQIAELAVRLERVTVLVMAERVAQVARYIDAVNFAKRATAPRPSWDEEEG